VEDRDPGHGCRGILGAAVGFGGLLLFTTFARSRFNPRLDSQVSLLAQSLAFQADGNADLARELGALHLDLSAYLMSAPKVLAQAAGATPMRRIEDSVAFSTERYSRALSRIRELRNTLHSEASSVQSGTPK
jgi:hypothetical protein